MNVIDGTRGIESFSMEEMIMLVLVLSIIVLLPMVMHFRQERVVLKHQTSQKVKEIPFLYSWSSLMFGLFVPLVRGDIKWFIIYLLAMILTGGLGIIVLAFYYNKSYMKRLILKGYRPNDERSRELILSIPSIKPLIE